jgi:hypothetical protein
MIGGVFLTGGVSHTQQILHLKVIQKFFQHASGHSHLITPLHLQTHRAEHKKDEYKEYKKDEYKEKKDEYKPEESSEYKVCPWGVSGLASAIAFNLRLEACTR